MSKFLFSVAITILVSFTFISASYAVKPSKLRIKFYDFSEQLIDGEIKRPQALYTDVRQEIKFKRMLRIKKSFLGRLYNSAKHPSLK